MKNQALQHECSERNISRARAVNESMEKDQVAGPLWIQTSILLGAGFFLLALFLSAVFEPKIRILHSLQALIYVVIILLTRRNSAWGFGAGCLMAAFWNYVNLFITTFIETGLEQVSVLFQTGELQRPDLALAVVAAGGHFLLMIACLAGFFRLRPGVRQLGQFLGGGALAVGYLVVIILATGPQYLELLKRAFRL